RERETDRERESARERAREIHVHANLLHELILEAEPVVCSPDASCKTASSSALQRYFASGGRLSSSRACPSSPSDMC
ncbi:MAG: hypothetical protein ACPIOQ_54095, partial [Promethearchaeia archaeon]